jgi:hypothetical protein
MDQRFSLTSFSLSKAENVGLVGIIVKQNFSKSTGMSLKELLFASFNKIELDMSVDGLSSIRGGNGEQSTPLSVRAEHITNNLSCLQIS